VRLSLLSFLFYGADGGAAQAGQKGGRAGEAARRCTHSWERGELKGGLPGHTIRSHIFPFLYMPMGCLVVINPRFNSEGSVFKSQSSRNRNFL
jgi:hypothetical protein